jgi:hypothetical protein
MEEQDDDNRPITVIQMQEHDPEEKKKPHSNPTQNKVSAEVDKVVDKHEHEPIDPKFCTPEQHGGFEDDEDEYVPPLSSDQIAFVRRSVVMGRKLERKKRYNSMHKLKQRIGNDQRLGKATSNANITALDNVTQAGSKLTLTKVRQFMRRTLPVAAIGLFASSMVIMIPRAR